MAFCDLGDLIEFTEGGQSEWLTPQNFHAALGSTVSRGGMWLSVLVLPSLPGAR